MFAAIGGMLLVGAVLIVLAIVGEQPRGGTTGRVASYVVGGFLIVGAVYLAVMTPRTLRGSRFWYTPTALIHDDGSGTASAIPWADIATVTISLARKPGRWEPRIPSVDIVLRPGVGEQYPRLQRFRRDGRYALPFWEHPDLLASMDYGCRSYAGDRYRGMHPGS